jgi:hypothetical protein
MGGVCEDAGARCGKARSGMDTVSALWAKEAKSVEGELCVEKEGEEYEGETQAEVVGGGDEEAKENEWDCDETGVRGVARKCRGGKASDC